MLEPGFKGPILSRLNLTAVVRWSEQGFRAKIAIPGFAALNDQLDVGDLP